MREEEREITKNPSSTNKMCVCVLPRRRRERDRRVAKRGCAPRPAVTDKIITFSHTG